jgi:hypothetical protein
LTTTAAEPAKAVANPTSQHQQLSIAGGEPTRVMTEVHTAGERVIEACMFGINSFEPQSFTRGCLPFSNDPARVWKPRLVLEQASREQEAVA